ncbi:MAG TPA: thioredoxin domain-containing protein [Ktedonobacteraceae bacterium]|jgi:thioredoxin 1|nr:thioredoxin domain-containing protein [Ktedonobacteraceae bacterium]
MADSYIDVTEQDFEEKVLSGSQMVVVNFSAAWSSPCQILQPEFEAISKEYQDRVTFARVDVDQNKELTTRWSVDGVPILVFFFKGQEINRIQGVVMRDKLRRQVEGTLLATSS